MKQKFWWLGNSLKQYIDFPLLFMEGGHRHISEGNTASFDGHIQGYEIFHGLREHHVCPGWVKKLVWACIRGLELWGLKYFMEKNTGLEINVYKHLFEEVNLQELTSSSY